jgi:phosphoglycolate phosphatase-like HAD superfamily hydrolase
MVRLILFDIDGTLIRTGGAGVKAFAKVFETEFNAVEGFEKLKFAGRTDISLVREFFNYHTIPTTPENFERFFTKYVFWLDHIIKDSVTEICEGVAEFIAATKSLPDPPLLALLTGNIRSGAEIKLQRVSLWDTFQTGGFADDHEHRDEIAAVARERGAHLLKRELAHDEVLVIGDTPLDIRCARAINARVLAVGTGGAPLVELENHRPDWAVRDLSHVKAADVLS